MHHHLIVIYSRFIVCPLIKPSASKRALVPAFLLRNHGPVPPVPLVGDETVPTFMNIKPSVALRSRSLDAVSS